MPQLPASLLQTKLSLPPRAMTPNQTPPCLYFIYGNNETEVNNARYELVCSLLTPEERDSGLTEIRSPGNMPLSVDSCYGEIIAELGTSSFIADSKRVVVVYDLSDFFAKKRAGRKPASTAKKTKATPKLSRTDILLKWLSEGLPDSGNILIFVCTENDEKQKTVAPTSPLYDYARRVGKIIEKREKPLNYEFEEAVYSGNSPKSLFILRDWIKRVGHDSGGRLRIYNTVSNILEMTMQAKCFTEAEKLKIPRAQVAVPGFPSLDRAPDWKVKKIRNFARQLSMEKLHKLIKDTNKLQTYMYPKGTEPYIPNWDDQLEMIVLQLTL